MKLPAHGCALHLTHNAYRTYYKTVGAYLAEIESGGYGPDWKDENARRAALSSGSVWELQWYPDTPVGFYYIAAPTLEELLAYAAEVEAEEARKPA